ncbi:MAG TPA: cobalt ECF transporter T component CbiQ, partial [Kribbella sp.]
MSGDGLLVAVDSPVHRIPAQVKLVALVVFVLTVVSTPAAVFWAFGMYAVLLGGAVMVAKLPVPV